MALEARISPFWRKQKLYFALFFVAVAALFGYDGCFGWPRSNARNQPRVDAHDQLEGEGRGAEWKDYAKSHGWPEVLPKIHSRNDIIGQYAIAGIALLVGLILLSYWFTQRHRTLRADEEAVYTPGGNRVPFTSIVGVGKKNWEAKGLATVRYEEHGQQRQFIVDDYKYEAEPTHQILQVIEERLVERTSGLQG
jgi:hypothetical protein